MKKAILFLAVVVILSACVSQTTTNTPLALPQELSATPAGAETALPLTATAIALPELETSCISISPAPADLAIEGTALFLDGVMIVSRGKNDLQIPAGPEDPSVSPHNKFLAYHEGGDLLVATSNGTVIRRIKSGIVGAWIGGNWISDEYIRHFDVINWKPLQLQSLVVNVQTGESLTLRMDFPDMEKGWVVGNPALSYYGSDRKTNVIYDPFLSKVVHPQKGSFIVLYNVSEDREQARIGIEGSDPTWSPDGQYFTFKGLEQKTPVEIYIIPRNGERFMPLTSLSNIYANIGFGTYSWSPDSRKIAFWARKTNTYGERETLFIVDLTTMKIRDTCLEGIGSFGSVFEAGLTWLAGGRGAASPTGKNFILAGKPIWSPGSEKVLITQFDEQHQQVIDLLVDLRENIAYPIAMGLEPMGWLSDDP
jgi:hypothetical protein